MKLIAVTNEKTAETHLVQLDLVRSITMNKNVVQFQFGLDDSWHLSKEQLGDDQFDRLSGALLALAAELKDGRFRFV
jgi:hypothetical protein